MSFDVDIVIDAGKRRKYGSAVACIVWVHRDFAKGGAV